VGPDLVPHALAVLFAVGGTPSVYAGDEFGWTAVKEERLGGDDAVRPEFPAAPGEVADVDERILDAHRALIALRRRHPWLWRARTDVVEVANDTLVLRTAVDAEAIVVALSLRDAPVSLPAADAAAVVAGDGPLRNGRVDLPARGWAVLEG
jgi:glycosidase